MTVPLHRLDTTGDDNSSAAFSTHGTHRSTRQSRLVFVLDQKTLLSLWFSIINGRC